MCLRMSLTHLSVSPHYMTEAFGAGVCNLIIICLLCAYPQIVGGKDVKRNSSLILHPLVLSLCIVLCLTGLFKCLLISGNTNKQADQPGGEDKAPRGSRSHSSPYVTGIVLEQAPDTADNDHRGQEDKKEREAERHRERELEIHQTHFPSSD